MNSRGVKRIEDVSFLQTISLLRIRAYGASGPARFVYEIS